uniref:PGR5-like protein 1A, chloroplastic n=1 Tax=Helicotheca tamesis TaxID=374047 RepID=A0A7S2I6A5_9STRA
MRFAILCSALALLVSETNAFSAQMRPSVSSLAKGSATFARPSTILSMSSTEEEDRVSLTSVKKEIAYDESTGRFYEFDEGECIPDEEFCVISDDTGEPIRLTIEEKERMFMDALQSYYISGKQVMSDDDFDSLKEDLSWNGSKLVEMSRKEASYLAAVQAYLKGSPIMSDTEFDTLKRELKEDGSQFAVSKEPKCLIETGICTVTLEEDRFRSNLLYLPAGSIFFLLWLGIGFELIEPWARLNPVILIALGLPLIVQGTETVTNNYIFPDNKIAYGPCPKCGAQNRVYFGNILGVEGFGDEASVKCGNCKETFTVQKSTLRASTLPDDELSSPFFAEGK